MSEQPAKPPVSGGPKLNPHGDDGQHKFSKQDAQELAHKAAQKTAHAARVTGKSFLNVFKIWAGLAADPVGRTPGAAQKIAPPDAWQSLAWVAVLYALTLPGIEYNMLPLFARHSHNWIQYALHAITLCIAMPAAVFGIPKLFGGKTTLESAAFAASIALLPGWITISIAGLLADWTTKWIFGLITFGACVSLFILWSVFTRAYGLSDRRATLAVPLALGLGTGVAFYLGKIAS